MAVAGSSKRKGNHFVIDYKKVLDGTIKWEDYSTPDLIAGLRSFPTDEVNIGTLQDYDRFEYLMKEELAKRPHLRNKAQAKAERLAKAKAQRNR